MSPGRRTAVLVSAVLLLPAGHAAAICFRNNTSLPWLYSTLFYGAWLIACCFLFLRRTDIAGLLRRPVYQAWYLLPLLCVVPLFLFVFLPNRSLLRADGWLAAQVVLCLTGPLLEELYWRGLPAVAFRSPLLSFLFSCVLFGASHPLVFGVNSHGDSGWVAFGGTALIGGLWWLSLRRTRSLRGCILTHVLVDIAGMAVYVLADRAALLPL
ncbi:MAG: hypothetical protein JWP27_1396 [Flaviaesturariibacter sp.]|nr:hypothetical protein [Flaviaesturariibacter sp.]